MHFWAGQFANGFFSSGFPLQTPKPNGSTNELGVGRTATGAQWHSTSPLKPKSHRNILKLPFPHCFARTLRPSTQNRQPLWAFQSSFSETAGCFALHMRVLYLSDLQSCAHYFAQLGYALPGMWNPMRPNLRVLDQRLASSSWLSHRYRPTETCRPWSFTSTVQGVNEILAYQTTCFFVVFLLKASNPKTINSLHQQACHCCRTRCHHPKPHSHSLTNNWQRLLLPTVVAVDCEAQSPAPSHPEPITAFDPVAEGHFNHAYPDKFVFWRAWPGKGVVRNIRMDDRPAHYIYMSWQVELNLTWSACAGRTLHGMFPPEEPLWPGQIIKEKIEL